MFNSLRTQGIPSLCFMYYKTLNFICIVRWLWRHLTQPLFPATSAFYICFILLVPKSVLLSASCPIKHWTLLVKFNCFKGISRSYCLLLLWLSLYVFFILSLHVYQNHSFSLLPVFIKHWILRVLFNPFKVISLSQWFLLSLCLVFSTYAQKVFILLCSKVKHWFLPVSLHLLLCYLTQLFFPS